MADSPLRTLDLLTSIRKILRWTPPLLAVFILLDLSWLGLKARGFESGTVTRLVSMGGENNPFTWYSSAMLGLCAILLMFLWSAKRADGDHDTRYWAGLAILFLLLSLDETASLHETLGIVVRRFRETTGFLYFAWVLPGAVFVVLFGLVYLRFLGRLGPAVRWRFVGAGVAFVGGAIGIEVLEARYFEAFGENNTTARLLTVVEETAELLGVWMFARVLAAQFEGLRLAPVLNASGDVCDTVGRKRARSSAG